jgi:hypothetical protein
VPRRFESAAKLPRHGAARLSDPRRTAVVLRPSLLQTAIAIKGD